MERAIRFIEKIGNRLPHPFWLFVYICLATVALSALAELLSWHAVNPVDGKTVAAASLLSRENLVQLLLGMVDHFVRFAPLGLVVVMLMGVSVSEKSGLLESVMKWVVLKVPRWLVFPAIVVLGACGNIGSDAGIVIVPPLAAIIFKRMGYHPLAGIILGYASATAGFTANLVPAGTDVLLAGITTAVLDSDAMRSLGVAEGTQVVATANLYFMIASVFMLAVLFSFVLKWFTLPLFKDYRPETGAGQGIELAPRERRGLAWAGVAAALYLAAVLATIVPENGLLRHAEPGRFLQSPFFKALVPILFGFFVLCGWVYGKIVGTIRTKMELFKSMVEGVEKLAGYIVLCFVIAQFIHLFHASRLDQIASIKGAEFLRAAEFTGPLLFVAFIAMAMLINLFIGSSSAKWAMLAPVFVPMFYQVGIPPAVVQLLYRLGDSITNGISPLYVMFPLILGWTAQYRKDAGVGTIFGLLLPYAVLSAIVWIAMFLVWYWIGLDIGIGEPVRGAGS